MSKPNLFILGAPKSGTTTLFDYLKNHSEICSSNVKEPMYFVHEDPNQDSKYTKSSYLDLFSNYSGEPYVMEASTWYLYSPFAANNIFNFNPNAKLIAILRKPNSLVNSLYHFRKYTGRESASSLENAIECTPERISGRNLPNGTDLLPMQYDYTGVIEFDEQLKRYNNIFPEKNILVLNFDQLKSNPFDLMDEICEFLEIKKFDSNQLEVLNSNKGRVNISNKLKRFINNPPRWIKTISRKTLSSKHRSLIYYRISKIISLEKKSNNNKEKIGIDKLDAISQKVIEYLNEKYTSKFANWKSK